MAPSPPEPPSALLDADAAACEAATVADASDDARVVVANRWARLMRVRRKARQG